MLLKRREKNTSNEFKLNEMWSLNQLKLIWTNSKLFSTTSLRRVYIINLTLCEEDLLAGQVDFRSDSIFSEQSHKHVGVGAGSSLVSGDGHHLVHWGGNDVIRIIWRIFQVVMIKGDVGWVMDGDKGSLHMEKDPPPPISYFPSGNLFLILSCVSEESLHVSTGCRKNHTSIRL